LPAIKILALVEKWYFYQVFLGSTPTPSLVGGESPLWKTVDRLGSKPRLPLFFRIIVLKVFRKINKKLESPSVPLERM